MLPAPFGGLAEAVELVCIAVLGLTLGRIAWSDMTRRIVPNRDVVLVAMLGAVSLLTKEPSLAELLGRLAVLMGFGLVLLGLFAAGTLGGGDVKLMLTAPLWLTPSAMVPFILFLSLAGALVAIGTLVMTRLGAQVQAGVPYAVAICAALMGLVLKAYWS